MSVKEVRAQFHLSLFGTKISLSLSPEEEEEDQPSQAKEFTKSSKDATRVENVDDIISPSSSGGSDDDEKICPAKVKESVAEVPVSHTDAIQTEQTDVTTAGSNKQQLKRPDKPVPCPRCNSLDTKFCYYNNYNVNQPRHFCKNCQRYWTAGGTLRNVPVGAGRRKNKAGGGGGRVDGVVPRGSLQENTGKLKQSTGCKRSLDIPTKEQPSVVRPRKGGGACSEENGSLQRSISGGSDASNDSRDDSTCGSSVSNPEEARGACFPGIYNNSNNNNNKLKSHRAPENGRGPGGLWHGFPWSVPPPWCPNGWNGAWNSPWGNLAASAASAAARAIADNVGSLHWRPPSEQTASTHKSPLWAPKTLRVDAPRHGCSTFLGDIGAGNKAGLSISTGGMFKAFQQENSNLTAKATVTSDDGEEAEKSGTVAA